MAARWETRYPLSSSYWQLTPLTTARGGNRSGSPGSSPWTFSQDEDILVCRRSGDLHLANRVQHQKNDPNTPRFWERLGTAIQLSQEYGGAYKLRPYRPHWGPARFSYNTIKFPSQIPRASAYLQNIKKGGLPAPSK